VAHRAGHEIRVALEARERAREDSVRLTLAVYVRGQDGPDAVAGAQERNEPVLVDRLAEPHESTAAPGPDCHVVGQGHIGYR
jgi:hypothetical protein